MEHTRWEDFDYTYLDELNGNPLGWLGNGYTMADYDNSSRTTYLDPDIIDYPPIPSKMGDARKAEELHVLPNGGGKIHAVVNIQVDDVGLMKAAV